MVSRTTGGRSTTVAGTANLLRVSWDIIANRAEVGG